MKVLVTGGVRSGKSLHAEWLLRHRDDVTYIAPGAPADADDADWRSRVAAHQQRRNPAWATVETSAIATTLHHNGAFLIDCIGTWLTALLDEHAAWEAPAPRLEALIATELDQLGQALSHADDVVIVTNEVGLGLVPPYRSGRVFRDLLGSINRQLAQLCDQVHLVVAGRILVLPESPSDLAL